MHCKNNKFELSIFYNEDPHTVQNKGDLDIGIKNKTLNLDV